MPDFETVVTKNSNLIRKGLNGSVVLGRWSQTSSTAEVQTVTITGTPTGGTFTLTYAGQTTAGIVYNAAASAVQSALEALSNLAPGDVTCTGGALPGTAVTATFASGLGDISQMTASSAGLTGGTTPTVTVATATPGVTGAAPLIESLTAEGGMIALPSGYESAGWISEDGLTFAQDMEVSDVRGWGSSSFLRRDTQSTDKTMQFAALEYKRLTKELQSGLDLRAIEMSAEGEWKFDHPDRPPTQYWRALAVATDGSGDDQFFFAKFFPKSAVSEMDDEAWSDGDDPLMFNVTLSALVDDIAGYSCREFMWGPGALAAAAAMGITVAA